MSLSGLVNINVELTSRCNKNCWMCGRRERDHLYKDLKYGDMEFDLVKKIASEVPEGIVVQLHNNGESLLYPRFGSAVSLFGHCITNIVTNGKLLVEKASEIVDNLDILSISIFQNDLEAEEQYSIIERFLKIKGDRKPFTTLRFIGSVDTRRYEKFGLLLISRTLHAPRGSVDYEREPTVPEIGVCWDFLTRLSIDRYGNVSTCVRFDPEGQLILGNIQYHSLEELWNCDKRLWMKRMHCSGRRMEIPYCGSKCHYWGIPISNKGELKWPVDVSSLQKWGSTITEISN